MPVVPLPTVKDFLTASSGTAPVDSSRDDELIATIERAEAILEKRVGPLSTVTVTDEVHTGPGPLILRRYPVVSVASATNNGSTVADVELDPDSGVVYGSFHWQGHRKIKVTYTAGRTAPLPADLEGAVLELVAHLWKSQRVPGAVRPSAFAQQGEQDVQVGSGFLLPYRVQTLIEPYLVPSVA